MNQESIRAYCKRLPHVTEEVQWGDHLLFKVGGKMFCVMPTEASQVMLSFKASPDNFIQLQEIDGIIPAPYMARAKWLGLRRLNLLRDDEMKELLSEAHSLIFASLPKKRQAELAAPRVKPRTKKTATRRAKA